ncbi:MAG: hypothetical protein MR436_10995 [Eubacterium sp.]|nr:hypothetical protein [Eubacterium sp.]
MQNAEQYPVSTEVDRVFFFNPFSVEILQKAFARVMESYYKKPLSLDTGFSDVFGRD